MGFGILLGQSIETSVLRMAHHEDSSYWDKAEDVQSSNTTDLSRAGGITRCHWVLKSLNTSQEN